MKQIKIQYIFLLMISMTFGACSKWLDVKSKDRIMEEELFSTRGGYLKALNGVYIQLAGDNLYGRNLSAGMLDAMAQYYTARTATLHAFSNHAGFLYTQNNVMASLEAIWQGQYNMIANCNAIVYHCDAPSISLLEKDYNIVKGEALALRAFLHFDVLRMFGPIYTEANKGVKAMPYATSSEQRVSPLLTVEAITDSIIKDLKAAANLLEAYDPVITEGAANVADFSTRNELQYRQYRLNYYAVKALLARVYLWKGDKTQAALYAQQVIDECHTSRGSNPIFPFVTKAAAENAANPDRLFSTEVLFAAYDDTRQLMYEGLFAPSLQVSSRLYFFGDLSGRINEMYDDKNDYRYKVWSYDASIPALEHNKFNELGQDSLDFMIPLLRISEMYFIAAECNNSLAALNKVRAARSCADFTDASSIAKYIQDEYRREMLNEGQLFFFYKRLGKTSIPDGATAATSYGMNIANYQFPMVNSELSTRTDVP